MAIYETRGFTALVYPYKGQLEPFDYIANFKPLVVPKGTNIAEYKRTQAPYCLSGKVQADKKGTYRRNNASLVYRDLIFLDYDEIKTGVDFPEIVSDVLFGYSYIIYPTIKHTTEMPRYRLVVKPNNNLDETAYKQVVKEIADKIGLPFDITSLTWSQLQGLPVTTGNPANYQKIVEYGLDYPIPKSNQSRTSDQRERPQTYTPRPRGKISMTMRIIDTLFNGFGDKGGRNVAVTRFVGLLLNKWVDCDLYTAYELTKIANSVTAEPLPIEELDRVFSSIARAEYKKRG